MTTIPFRLRVELPDRPGSLAHVASIIAEHGGNVVSIDIHEMEGAQAVDEIVVQLPEDWTPALLASELRRRAAGTLLSSTADATGTDAVVRGLRWATALVRAGALDGGLELARGLAQVCTSSVASILTVDEALSYEAGRLALERGAPVSRLGPTPTPLAADLPSVCWTLAVPDDAVQPSRVAFIGRASAFRFTTSEISRVEALLQLVREVACVAK